MDRPGEFRKPCGIAVLFPSGRSSDETDETDEAGLGQTLTLPIALTLALALTPTLTPNPDPNNDPNPDPNQCAAGGVRVPRTARAAPLDAGRASMVRVPPWQCPSSAPAPPHAAPGGSGQLGYSQEEVALLGAQPPLRVLEPAASKAADFAAHVT